MSLLDAHLVFVTKYRRRVLTDAMLTDCESTRREVCDALGAELVDFNGETDHVHPLVRYPPALAISTLVRRSKGRNRTQMRADHPPKMPPCPDARPLLDTLPLRGFRRQSAAVDHQAEHRTTDPPLQGIPRERGARPTPN